jgi:signal transduction histidine kinase
LRIILLFNNLISNAIKYHDMSKENPYIKVDVLVTANNALIEVEDNGLGIEEEFQSRIFDMFFRANKTVSGTGLGLFIVKGAIDKLKGTIKLKSKSKQGTTFVVDIPNRI